MKIIGLAAALVASAPASAYDEECSDDMHEFQDDVVACLEDAADMTTAEIKACADPYGWLEKKPKYKKKKSFLDAR